MGEWPGRWLFRVWITSHGPTVGSEGNEQLWGRDPNTNDEPQNSPDFFILRDFFNLNLLLGMDIIHPQMFRPGSFLRVGALSPSIVDKIVPNSCHPKVNLGSRHSQNLQRFSMA
jgi:hypothetical protein